MALNHIHLKVKDVSVAQSFYIKYFGFQVVDQNPIEVYLSDGMGSWLTLSAATSADRELPGWFHFGFCFDSPEDVREKFRQLKAGSFRFDRELTQFGDDAATFYVVDPDGNRVEVSWIKARRKP